MEKYNKIRQIGKGASGKVILASRSGPDHFGEKVAIKKISYFNKTNGVAQEAYRELLFLQNYSHPTYVQVLDTFLKKKALYLVMEYVEKNLEQLIPHFQFDDLQTTVKSIFRQLLEGLAHCHAHGYLHRDIKPANVLVRADYSIALIDFGLTKFALGSQKLTGNVCTVWYRAPELCMGAKTYGPEVDIWSAGLVFAQMLLGKPVFAESSEVALLGRIFALFGTPESASNLPHSCTFKPTKGQSLEGVFLSFTPTELDLFASLCKVDPEQRLSAKAALQHPYFSDS